MTLLRLIALLLLVAALTAAAASWRDRARISRMQHMVDARRELAATTLAPAGSAPQAGISARAPIEVAAFPARLARGLQHDADFHRLSHRCGVCHNTPDPALHTAAEWPDVVGRMSTTIDAAGLLPLGPADRAAVLRVLTASARP
jgi:hypothetical protein